MKILTSDLSDLMSLTQYKGLSDISSIYHDKSMDIKYKDEILNGLINKKEEFCKENFFYFKKTNLKLFIDLEIKETNDLIKKYDDSITELEKKYEDKVNKKVECISTTLFINSDIFLSLNLSFDNLFKCS